MKERQIFISINVPGCVNRVVFPWFRWMIDDVSAPSSLEGLLLLRDYLKKFAMLDNSLMSRLPVHGFSILHVLSSFSLVIVIYAITPPDVSPR